VIVTIKDELYVSPAIDVSIMVEDAQAYCKGSPISMPGKVGFYGGSYYMDTTNSAYVNPQNGVQFQTSSSCGGPWPLSIRMKVLMRFN
jgi:hypothetical protein